MNANVKAVALILMGLFLYSRFFNGNLFYYISERFVWLTILASVAFIIVGLSYRIGSRHQHDHEGHSHDQFSWGGLALVALPIVLGLLVPPRPLGAAALTNRDVSVESLTSAAAPESNNVLARPKGERNILDWVIDFRQAGDPAAFTGEEARVIGFAYRDERFAADQFMVARFVVSCCAADAAPLGLIVQWPDSQTLTDDQWVEVAGHIEPGRFAGEAMPILIADSITPTDIPERPYLYPY
jgi:uncharacterized repeat protein (TIGR03943 family)